MTTRPNKKVLRAMKHETLRRARKYLAQTPRGLSMTEAQLTAGAKTLAARGMAELRGKRRDAETAAAMA